MGCEPGRVDSPLGSQKDTSNLSGDHQGTVLILLQLPLPQHDAQDVGRIERQAPRQVRAVPCEMLRPEDGWLGALRVACPNQVQEQWVLGHFLCEARFQPPLATLAGDRLHQGTACTAWSGGPGGGCHLKALCPARARWGEGQSPGLAAVRARLACPPGSKRAPACP